MYISSLNIKNFRNFKNANFSFKQGVNTIIGENGSGKSNLFYAMRMLIDDSLPRYLKLAPNDFNRTLTEWRGHWIVVQVELSELDSSEESMAFAFHALGKVQHERKGSASLIFRPKITIRKKLYEYSKERNKTKDGLIEILSQITIDDYEPNFFAKGEANFCKDEVYSKYVGDFEKIVFPNPEDKEELAIGVKLFRNLNLHDEVSCTYIKALRDVESDLKSYSTNPLISLFRGKGKGIEISKQKEISDEIDELNDEISSLDEVIDVRDNIEKSLHATVGSTYAPGIELKSELPNDIEKLFQSLKLWIGDSYNDDYKGKVNELSLGGANLIYLSLKLLEYEKVKTERSANFLLIEEPEAHIHTHIQKTLFNNLASGKTQIFVSTHSTHISSASKISSMNVLSRGDQQAHVFNPSLNLSPSQITHAERYLDAIRGNLLFAKGVILVEGDAEQILLPQMFKQAFGLALDEIGVSIVNVSSTGFENIGVLFHSDRIQKHCAILTDSDSSIIQLPNDPKQDTKQQGEARASELSGKNRKKLLEVFISKNPFIRAFYASYTFEVDFVEAGNSEEVIWTLPNIYSEERFIEASKKRLEHEDISIFGGEVLRLAEKEKKGWFALLLSEVVFYRTYIPKYMLEAVAFSAPHLNIKAIVKMITYRLSKMKNDKNHPDSERASRFVFLTVDDELILSYMKSFPDDQLSKFLELYEYGTV